jgi:hypothetical protein
VTEIPEEIAVRLLLGEKWTSRDRKEGPSKSLSLTGEQEVHGKPWRPRGNAAMPEQSGPTRRTSGGRQLQLHG